MKRYIISGLFLLSLSLRAEMTNNASLIFDSLDVEPNSKINGQFAVFTRSAGGLTCEKRYQITKRGGQKLDIASCSLKVSDANAFEINRRLDIEAVREGRAWVKKVGNLTCTFDTFVDSAECILNF